MAILEKIGDFYLGREYDMATAKALVDKPIHYDAKDLTTHAVCVGMTGSGKTGLCLALLEEAAIDGVPAICIDPKGDLGNLLLAFPDLAPGDFAPWVDPAEATRQGLTVDQLAEKTATKWREGLAQWDQDASRIQRFRDAVDIAIYTPGSNAGLPLTVLRSFSAPPPAVRDDADTMRERVASAASGLLALMGIDADPVRSREHILVSNILDQAWRAGQNLDLAGLIRAIQRPGFDKIGVIDLDSFFPEKDRMALAMQLNGLTASPSFSAWLQGESLDIQRLLYTPQGKPRLTILSIAHLSDGERMLFVTILLNEMIAWMRTQSGTSSLRALLYMDEVFGYFPPTANPPSKTPMLTLLKQARAFGLGVVLATQNPVDLDYKGLSNAGTWLLGRLQTERDKMRVLEGLEGASAAAGSTFDRGKMEATLAGLGNRVFLMNNVHDNQPVVFQSRWALSFLRGPVTRDQIAKLMAPRKAAAASAAAGAPGAADAGASAPQAPKEIGGIEIGERPMLPTGAEERFAMRRGKLPQGATLVYRPCLGADAKLHFVDAKSGVDVWESAIVSTGELADDVTAADAWENAVIAAHEEGDAPEYEDSPEDNARFAPLPGDLSKAKSYASLPNKLKDWLYRNHRLTVRKVSTPVKLFSKPGEAEGDFVARLGHALREARDAAVQDLKLSYVPKAKQLEERLRRAEVAVAKQKAEASNQTMQSVIQFGATILGAFVGRNMMSAQNVGKLGTSIRSAQRTMKARGGVDAAEDTVEAIQQTMAETDQQLQAEIDELSHAHDPANVTIESIDLSPRKTDLAVSKHWIEWIPWHATTDGKWTEAT